MIRFCGRNACGFAAAIDPAPASRAGSGMTQGMGPANCFKY
jgi:hypothetical protein